MEIMIGPCKSHLIKCSGAPILEGEIVSIVDAIPKDSGRILIVTGEQAKVFQVMSVLLATRGWKFNNYLDMVNEDGTPWLYTVLESGADPVSPHPHLAMGAPSAFFRSYPFQLLVKEYIGTKRKNA